MNKQKKKRKRAVSAEGEGPATAETADPLLVPSRLLRVREAWNPQYEGSLKIEKGGQGFFSLLLAFSLPRGEGSLTDGFQAWREAKGLDFTYDQISGQP